MSHAKREVGAACALLIVQRRSRDNRLVGRTMRGTLRSVDTKLDALFFSIPFFSSTKAPPKRFLALVTWNQPLTERKRRSQS